MSTTEPLPARRAPYCERPDVGAKGLRTQQRILDAALVAFGSNGYDRTTLDAIAAQAGCSRVSIYQYFSGKDDIFRHLARQVARQLRGSMDLLDPITPDAAGAAALRSWVGRYAETHTRFEPVFRAFGAAASSDAALAGGAALVSQRNVAMFVARTSGSPLHARDLETTALLSLGMVSRALDIAAVLRGVCPDVYTRARVDRVVADTVHRALFGSREQTAALDASRSAPPRLDMSDDLRGLFVRVASLRAEAAQPGRGALARLLAAGDAVICQHGYRGARVQHVVSAAGVSRGAFYRYFGNIADFVGVIGVRAVDDISQLLRHPPSELAGRSLRDWLERYVALQAAKGTITRVWMEAVADAHRGDRGAVYDWGRRRLGELLDPHAIDDIDIAALVMLATLESIGAVPRTAHEIDAAVGLVERAFLPGQA